MRHSSTYRHVRKAVAKANDTDLSEYPNKNGPGRTAKWLQRHPKLAPYYTVAVNLLSNGDRAQRPSWRAVRKMMVVVAQSPRIKMVGVGVVPYLLHLGRHERGSWRSFPRVVIDANLQVQS
jgi:hypothetical protein